MMEWTIARNGQQEGPFSSEDIRVWAQDGTLDPQTTYIWKNGMTAWLLLAESEFSPLTENRTAGQLSGGPVALNLGVSASNAGSMLQTHPTAANTSHNNPYAAPATQFQSGLQPQTYPGLKRLGYFLTSLLTSVGAIAILTLIGAVIDPSASDSENAIPGLSVIVVVAIAIIAFLWATLSRLQNLGQSRSTILFWLVPIVSVWLWWRLTACPEGYHQHRQLDTAGKVITALLILPYLATFILVVIV